MRNTLIFCSTKKISLLLLSSWDTSGSYLQCVNCLKQSVWPGFVFQASCGFLSPFFPSGFVSELVLPTVRSVRGVKAVVMAEVIKNWSTCLGLIYASISYTHCVCTAYTCKKYTRYHSNNDWYNLRLGTFRIMICCLFSLHYSLFIAWSCWRPCTLTAVTQTRHSSPASHSCESSIFTFLDFASVCVFVCLFAGVSSELHWSNCFISIWTI